MQLIATRFYDDWNPLMGEEYELRDHAVLSCRSGQAIDRAILKSKSLTVFRLSMVGFGTYRSTSITGVSIASRPARALSLAQSSPEVRLYRLVVSSF
jgi:hypothetical protein